MPFTRKASAFDVTIVSLVLWDVLKERTCVLWEDAMQ